jgi:hypothetical protein
MKLCTKCKHYDSWGMRCGRPIGGPSPVDGKQEKNYRRAYVERERWLFGCGKKGKYWEENL